MSENSKAKFVLFGDIVINLDEVVFYQKKTQADSISFMFVFKSGYTAQQNFCGAAAIASVPAIERMFYKFWGFGYDSAN